MQFVLTTAGLAALAGPSSPVLGSFKLGNAYNYTPVASDTNIRGAQVNTGVPSAPFVVDTNVVRYTVTIDATAGPFDFGEVGLFLQNGNLFALGSFSSLQHKEPSSNLITGGNVKIDCYVSVVGNAYAIYADFSNSATTGRIPVLGSVDNLPRPVDTDYNAYLCITNVNPYLTTLATADGGHWSFSGYEDIRASAVATAGSNSYVDTATNCGNLAFNGEVLIEFTSGDLRGTVRNVSSITLGGTRIAWTTPLQQTFAVGDSFILYERRALSPQMLALLSGLNPTLTAAELNQLDGVNLGDYLKRDGSVPMLGSLNANGTRILNVTDPVGLQDAATKRYVDNAISAVAGINSSLVSTVNSLNTEATLRNGTIAWTGDWNGGGYKLTNIATPTNSNDAATKSYVDSVVVSMGLHNNLSSIQGGSSTERYHLTAAQWTFLTNLTTSGYPVATTSGAGIVTLADTVAAYTGTSTTKALTPSSLVAAATAISDPPTSMQAALISAQRKPIFQGSMYYNTLDATVSTTVGLYLTYPSNQSPAYGITADGTSTKFTVPIPGIYRVSAHGMFLWLSSGFNSTVAFTLYVNDAPVTSVGSVVFHPSDFMHAFVPVSSTNTCSGSQYISLSASDRVSIVCRYVNGDPVRAIGIHRILIEYVRPQ